MSKIKDKINSHLNEKNNLRESGNAVNVALQIDYDDFKKVQAQLKKILGVKYLELHHVD